ncbi:MAG: response regulator transcription factor [Chitinophagaceae bacterium]|nr:response regulator transcription factor [Chitinophagaceae bacterium]
MSTRILLIEDEHSVASVIRKALMEDQYEVSLAMDAASAWDHISRWSYDLFILDVMLPGGNGMDLCRKIRKEGIHTPVLMLTALGSVDNIVMGLDAGADDYLTKPFKIAELLARVRSLLRRASAATPGSIAYTSRVNVLVFSDITLNLDEKNAQRVGRVIELTATEFRLLEYLMKNPRKVLSRMDILEKVWGYDFNLNTKTVDVYINYLRKKLEEADGSRVIHTVVGMGYILKEE